MIEIKFHFLFLTFLLVIFLDGYSTAGVLSTDSIYIETNASLNTFLYTNIYEKDYQIVGPVAVDINNIKKGTSCILKFSSPDEESYKIFRKEVFIQYQYVSFNEKGERSRWYSLKSLPIRISTGSQKEPPDRVVIYFYIKVPQSILIRRGVYQGEFNIEIE